MTPVRYLVVVVAVLAVGVLVGYAAGHPLAGLAATLSTP